MGDLDGTDLLDDMFPTTGSRNNPELPITDLSEYDDSRWPPPRGYGYDTEACGVITFRHGFTAEWFVEGDYIHSEYVLVDVIGYCGAEAIEMRTSCRKDAFMFEFSNLMWIYWQRLQVAARAPLRSRA